MTNYMISDGKGRYLRRDAAGNYVPVKDKTLGDIWEQRCKAINILSNCVSKNLRDRYKIVAIEKTDTPEQMNDVAEDDALVVNPNNCVAQKISNEPVEENQISGLSASLDGFAQFIHSTEQRREVLEAALIDVEKEIVDINHYIEFGKFNAYQGWLAFQMLKGRLNKRRTIKDELHILSRLGECKINSEMLADIKVEISKLGTRKYTPRKLTELFG